MFLLFVHLQVPLPHHDGLPVLPQLHENCGPEGHEECEDDCEIIVKEISDIVEMTRLMQRSDWSILGEFWADWPLGYFRCLVTNFTTSMQNIKVKYTIFPNIPCIVYIPVHDSQGSVEKDKESKDCWHDEQLVVKP